MPAVWAIAVLVAIAYLCPAQALLELLPVLVAGLVAAASAVVAVLGAGV